MKLALRDQVVSSRIISTSIPSVQRSFRRRIFRIWSVLVSARVRHTVTYDDQKDLTMEPKYLVAPVYSSSSYPCTIYVDTVINHASRSNRVEIPPHRTALDCHIPRNRTRCSDTPAVSKSNLHPSPETTCLFSESPYSCS